MQSKAFAVLNVPRGGTGGVWRVNLTGQNATIGATDLVAASSVDGGLYVLKGIARVTTVAGTSSSVNVRISYTEDDNGLSVSGVSTEGLLGSPAGMVITPVNSTAADGIFFFNKVINARAGIAIQYQTAYNSNPAGAMVYSLHLMASRF